jgi:hypothetical protein
MGCRESGRPNDQAQTRAHRGGGHNNSRGGGTDRRMLVEPVDLKPAGRYVERAGRGLVERTGSIV